MSRVGAANGRELAVHSSHACIKQCDLVVARCDEDLSWVRNAAHGYARVFVYNKCGSDLRTLNHSMEHFGSTRASNVEAIEAPNVGSVDYAIIHHIIRFYRAGLANLTVFCEANTPRLCLPDSVIRPVGLTSAWPVPYAPSEVFSADAAHTFGHLTHRMDLAGFSSRWWGNCSYSYQSSKHRRFPFIRAPFANFGSWLRHTLGEALTSDLMSNTLSYLVLSGYFSVEADNIRRYPLALYQALAAQQVAPNEEVDHFIERLW